MKLLSELQEGEKVLLKSMYWERIVTVTRLTKKYIIVGNSKYRKCDGYKAASDKWCTERLIVLTPEAVERIQNRQKHEELILQVKAISFSCLTNEQLQSILDIAYKE